VKKYIFILFVFIGFLEECLGQDTISNSYFIEGNYQYGFIWQHNPSLSDVIGGNINVFQLNVGKETASESYWNQLYRYPEWGIGYYFADLGNGNELGLANAVFAFINVPIINSRKFQLRYKLSGGLAYLNKGNVAIGSPINIYLDACLHTKIALGKQLYLVNSFGATHFSNGAIKTPNLGLNLFSYRMGFQYNLQETNALKNQVLIPEIEHKNFIIAIFSMGVKEVEYTDGKDFMIVSGVLGYLRQLNHKYKIGAGFDVFYDESLFYTMNSDYSLDLDNSDIMRYGIHLSSEVQINKFVLGINLGTYLMANYTDDGKNYQRVTVRYLISKSLFANVSLKTSKGVAHFVEWGIGYQFSW
jgi:hypothetical protein